MWFNIILVKNIHFKFRYFLLDLYFKSCYNSLSGTIFSIVIIYSVFRVMYLMGSLHLTSLSIVNLEQVIVQVLPQVFAHAIYTVQELKTLFFSNKLEKFCSDSLKVIWSQLFNLCKYCSTGLPLVLILHRYLF